MSDQLRIMRLPELKKSSLVISWSADVSNLAPGVADYLRDKLGGESFAEIEPLEFFPLGGVAIQDNLVEFPDSRFYVCPHHELVIFKSVPPARDWFRFLNVVLDMAEQCHVKEIFTMGGMVSLSAHTAPRQLLGVYNAPELKKVLGSYEVAGELDYESPPEQRPTLNSFLSWAAKRRNIPTVTLWAPMPFYLVAVDDPWARKRLLAFFDQRFSLGLDFTELDKAIERQGQKLEQLRHDFPDIDAAIRRLETSLSLTEEENEKLVREVVKFLQQGN
ncbi:MAG: PAC2 family protein [Chloroflexi bacterium]|nr:PAC2 family protein [Chloroflexota bacterium]